MNGGEAMTHTQEGVGGKRSAVPEYVSPYISEVLLDEGTIAARVREVGADIARDYAGKNPLLLGVLSGSFVFLADLSRAIQTEHEVSFMRASSYSGVQSLGEVRIVGIENLTLRERHVIIVEDIVDTGLTLEKVTDALWQQKPASLVTCTLLLKKTAKRDASVDRSLKYIAFRIRDEFVVGYGLDFNERLRHLPFVGIFRSSAVDR